MFRNIRVITAVIVFSCLALAVWASDVPVAQDTYVNPGSSANFSTSPVITVGGGSGSIGLLQFDLTSALPAGAANNNVAKATLWLYVSKVFSPGYVDVYQGTNIPWTEGSVNGANQPGPAPGTLVAA